MLASLAALALMVVAGSAALVWLSADSSKSSSLTVCVSAAIAALAGVLARRAMLAERGEVRSALSAAIHEVSHLRGELNRLGADLRYERGLVDQLLAKCQAQQERIAGLELDLDDAKSAAMGDSLEELRRARRHLESARDGFAGFLQKYVFPLSKDYERFVRDADACHQRMSKLIESLDGQIASLGFEDGAPVLRLRLPSDPVATFVGSEDHDVEFAAIDASRRKLASVFHSDKVRHLELRWVVDTFDAIFKYLEHQRARLEADRRAAS